MQNSLFDKITNILKKGAQERGATENIVVSNTPLWKGISIDMPKRYKEMYHGSVFEILCTESELWCKIGGDLVVDSNKEDTVQKMLEKSDCRVFDIHHHENRNETYKPESHMHFICRNKDRQETISLINFLRDY